jgi:hypothetical protein
MDAKPNIAGNDTEARKKLVNEKILKPSVIEKPVEAADAYAANTNDWRYLSAAAII